MQSDSPPTFYPHLAQRFQALIWSSLDSDLIKTAVFHAERYYAIDRSNHDARHLYATTLLRAGQTYSALHLVNLPKDQQCTGCFEMKARCCTVLGRHRQAREALEATLRDTSYVSSGPYNYPGARHVAIPSPVNLSYFSSSVVKQQDLTRLP